MINLRNIFKRNLNIPPVPPPSVPRGKRPARLEQGKPVQQEAFEQAVEELNKRIDFSNYLFVAVILVLFICFIGLWYSYWQFTSVSYNDYSAKVKELNDERYEFLENRINELENGTNLTTTPSPKR